MKIRTMNGWAATVAMAAGILAGCAQTDKSPDVATNIRRSLEQAGLKGVSVAQDRDKGVVTLGGQVASDDQKGQAESLAKSLASGQVVSDEIAVIPAGNQGQTKEVNADLDKGITQNLDAALVQNNLQNHVKFSVKERVVTLTGDVDSQAKRAQVQQMAAAIPNVQQVVNELQVKNQKATSSE
jgi:hyperosmotically inducible protein